MSIHYLNEQVTFQLKHKRRHTAWLKYSAEKEKKQIDILSYIFCNDAYLLKVNQQYLQHDTYTDIITFDYSSDQGLSGDIFISVERVQENAVKYKVSMEEELCRVMVHGLLHLAGYKDKTKTQKDRMRQKESYYLKRFNTFAYPVFSVVVLLFVLTGFYSCEEDKLITPKKRAYFRITFPKKEYRKYDKDCPFTFDYPNYAAVAMDEGPGIEPCWLNVYYPQYKGTLHLSYKKVDKNVNEYIEQSWNLASRHQIKASGIQDELVVRDTAKVFGLIFEIEGNAASSLQFYLTDSTRHFVRGSLYFDCPPNNDSLAPVNDFIKEDIYHMIQSFQWK
jgi:gliding motility-associated lipoprotein GldD/rRNA maturation RNase YbeY